MKIKIKKDGKSKNYKLISNWSEVTLEKWLKIIDFELDTKSEEAVETIALFSTLPKKMINQLALSDVAIIMDKIGELQSNQDTKLKNIIEINGVEYGFMPDLSSITLGEYADIEQFIKNGVEKHLPELMAVLYRPIKKKNNNEFYVIDAYDGDIRLRAEEMKQMLSEQVQSALVFFYHFVKVLYEILPSYLTEKLKEMKMQLRQKTLAANGLGLE